jgi:phosphotriesterase-related protein
LKLPEKILYAHEHTTIDLSGPKKNIDCRLDDFDATAAEYRRLAEHGVVGIIDQTNRGMGRNVAYVQKMAAQAGVEITHATGYYKEPFLPPECYTLTEQQLCDIMVKELTEGIEGTGVRATVIGEIGTSKDITETEAKVFRAASRAHAETGAPICTHTTLGTRGLEQLEIFKSFGVDLSRVVLSHIDLSADLDYMKRLLDQGVNIAFDTIGKCNYQPDVSRADWLSRRHADRHEHGHHPPQQLCRPGRCGLQLPAGHLCSAGKRGRRAGPRMGEPAVPQCTAHLQRTEITRIRGIDNENLSPAFYLAGTGKTAPVQGH